MPNVEGDITCIAGGSTDRRSPSGEQSGSKTQIKYIYRKRDTFNSPTGGFITPSQTKITLSQIHKGTYTKLSVQYYMNCYATIRNNEMYASQHEENFQA